MKDAKAIGIATFKPMLVIYGITLSEFSKLATQYAKERFGDSVEFEAIYEGIDNDRVGLYFKNPDNIPTETMQLMSNWGIAETTPYHNMDIFLQELFRSNEYEVEDNEEFDQPLIFIRTDYEAYEKCGGSQATQESEY